MPPIQQIGRPFPMELRVALRLGGQVTVIKHTVPDLVCSNRG